MEPTKSPEGVCAMVLGPVHPRVTALMCSLHHKPRAHEDWAGRGAGKLRLKPIQPLQQNYQQTNLDEQRSRTSVPHEQDPGVEGNHGKAKCGECNHGVECQGENERWGALMWGRLVSRLHNG